MPAKKIEIQSFIKNGKLTKNRDVIIDAFKEFEGKEVVFILKRKYKKRSNDQNAYYWGVIIEHWTNIIRNEWGEKWTKESTHDFLKQNLNFEEKVNEDGEIMFNPINARPIIRQKSTTENNTWTQEEYHKSCRDLAIQMFGYEIPLPDSTVKANF